VEWGNLYKGRTVLLSLFTPRNRVGWALDGGQRSTSGPVRSSDGNESRCALNRKLCGPLSLYGVQEKTKEIRVEQFKLFKI